MLCPKCGREISNPKAKFCPGCGTALPAAASAPTGQQPYGQQTSYGAPKPYGAGQQPYGQTPYGTQNSANGNQNTLRRPDQKAVKDRSGVVVVIAVVLVVLLLCGALAGAWFYFDLGDVVREKLNNKEDEVEIVISIPEAKNDLAVEKNGVIAMPEDDQKHTAVPSAQQIVLRNALPNETTTELRLTVDGQDMDFRLEGMDAVIPFENMNAFCTDKYACQVHIIAKQLNGTYLTAGIWVNCQDYSIYADRGGLEEYYNKGFLDFGGDMYGPFVSGCEDGFANVPSTGMVNVLTWAYYWSYLNSINNQNVQLYYSTAANTEIEGKRCLNELNSQNTYDINDFRAIYDDSESIQYGSDGHVTYRAYFWSKRTRRNTQEEAAIERRCRMDVVWEDGMWKVNAMTSVG